MLANKASDATAADATAASAASRATPAAFCVKTSITPLYAVADALKALPARTG